MKLLKIWSFVPAAVLSITPIAFSISCGNENAGKIAQDYETPEIKEEFLSFFNGFEKKDPFNEDDFKEKIKNVWNAYSLVTNESTKPNVSVAFSQKFSDVYSKGFYFDFIKKSIAPAIIEFFSENISISDGIEELIKNGKDAEREVNTKKLLNEKFIKIKFRSEETEQGNDLENSWKDIANFISLIGDRVSDTNSSDISISAQQKGFTTDLDVEKSRLFLKGISQVIQDEKNFAKNGISIKL